MRRILTLILALCFCMHLVGSAESLFPFLNDSEPSPTAADEPDFFFSSQEAPLPQGTIECWALTNRENVNLRAQPCQTAETLGILAESGAPVWVAAEAFQRRR